jgi:hypothetical protein
MTDGPGSVWSAACADLPSVRSCRPPDGSGGATGAGAVYCSDGGDPAARDRGNVVVRPGSRGEGAGGRRRVRSSKFLTGYNLASTVPASSPLNPEDSGRSAPENSPTLRSARSCASDQRATSAPTWLPEKRRRLEQSVPDAPRKRDPHQQPGNRYQAPLAWSWLQRPTVLRHPHLRRLTRPPETIFRLAGFYANAITRSGAARARLPPPAPPPGPTCNTARPPVGPRDCRRTRSQGERPRHTW